MTQRFFTAASMAALMAIVSAGAAEAADAKKTVADRPILTTESTEALLKQRDKWGSEPSQTSTDSKMKKDQKS